MNITPKLKGAFDLLFLFGRGIDAFSGEKRAALQSLIIPLALFPFTAAFIYFYPPKAMETGYAYGQILRTVALHAVISFALSLAFTAILAYAFGKLERFWLFLEASNWNSIATFAAALPLVLTAVMGWFPREEMDRIFVITQCYFYVVTACVIFRSFRVNWQLAGFMTIMTVFADQTVWKVLYTLMKIPEPW